MSPTWGAASAVAVDPQDESTVFAALGDDLWKSSDGGDSWSPTSPLSTTGGRELLALGVSGSDVYASAETVAHDFPCQRAPAIGCTYRINVFKSTDGGASWSTVFDGDGLQLFTYREPNRFVTVDPRASGTVFVGSRDGIIRTVDGGATWSNVGAGIPANARIHTLVLDPGDPTIMYAARATDAHGAGGIFKSVDTGASFVPAITGLDGELADVHSLVIDPAMPSTVYAGTAAGLARSIDGGASWQPFGGVAAAIRALAINPARPERWYAGTDAGFLMSTDAGATWQPPGGAIEAFHTKVGVRSLAIAASDPDVVYAGNDPFCVARTVDGGATWSLSRRGGCHPFEVRHLVDDPAEPGVLLAAGPTNWVYRSEDHGTTWIPSDTGVALHGTLAIDARTASAWVSGFRSTGVSTQTLSLLRSRNGGRQWELVGDAFPGAFPPHAFVFGESRMWVLGGGSRIVLSDDGGKTWSDPPIQPFMSGDVFAADPSSPGRFYAQFQSGGIARTLDGGGVWEYADAGIGVYFPLARLSALAIDPLHPARLYTAVEGGFVFTSADGAGYWTPVSTPVLFGQLAVNPVTSEVYGLSGSQAWVAPAGATRWKKLAEATAAAVATPVVDADGRNLYLYGVGIQRLRLGPCDPVTDAPECRRLDGPVRTRLRPKKSTLEVRGRFGFPRPANGLALGAEGGDLEVSNTWTPADCRPRPNRLGCESNGHRLNLRSRGANTFRLIARFRVNPETGADAPFRITIFDLQSGVEHTTTLTDCTRRRSSFSCRS